MSFANMNERLCNTLIHVEGTRVLDLIGSNLLDAYTEQEISSGADLEIFDRGDPIEYYSMEINQNSGHTKTVAH